MTKLAEAITGAASVRRSPTGMWEGRRPVALAHHHRERSPPRGSSRSRVTVLAGSGVVSGTGPDYGAFRPRRPEPAWRPRLDREGLESRAGTKRAGGSTLPPSRALGVEGPCAPVGRGLQAGSGGLAP